MTNPNNNGGGGRGANPQDALESLQKPDPNEIKPVTPTCGHCKAGKIKPWTDGAPIAMTELALGPLLLGVFHCGNPDCGAIHSIQVLQMMRPAGPPKPLIERV